MTDLVLVLNAGSSSIKFSAFGPQSDQPLLHGQIEGLAHRLRHDEELAGDGLAASTIPEVRAHLFAYEALLRTHIDREEQLLLPVLVDDAAVAGAAVGAALTT